MTQPRLHSLHGKHCSLVIECPPDAMPLWRYWGPKLARDGANGPSLLAQRATPSFSPDETPAFPVFPLFGLGWFGQTGLLAHRQGRDFAHGATRCTMEANESALRIHVHDAVAGLELALSLSLDPESDCLELRTSLTNSADAPLDLHWLASACLPLPDDAARVQSYTGRHNQEFVAQDEMLGRAIWRKENRRGLTSHDAFPGAVVTLPGTGAHQGAAYGAQLAWSGNHVQQIEALDDGRFQWQIGVWLAPGEVRLQPGEAFEAPAVIATFSPHGTGGVARNFHVAMRARVAWPDGAMKPRPVHLNTWEGYWFDHDVPRLKRLADEAAALGIERFVLDDGWFHRRDDDSRALGDWWPDARKYPDGLAPLADHVTRLGMEFGLWIEPEMINPDSDLFRAHPDWALQIAGRPLLTGRNQLVLDLARDEVADHVFTQIADVLEGLPVSYLKWDHNRDLTSAAGAHGRAAYREQIHAAYRLFARFRQAFPRIEIEACAGGGGRIDAGILQHTHRFWASDCIDALTRVDVQRGFLQFMPPELMGSHVGVSPAHSTGRGQSMDFRAAVAMQGHFGVELDLVSLADAEKARLARWIAFYKQWRHLLHAHVWQGQAGDNLVWHAAGSAEEWLLFVYRLQPMQLRHMPPVRLPFVERDAAYAVRSIGPEESGDAIHYAGDWLAQAGLLPPHMHAEAACIWHGVRA